MTHCPSCGGIIGRECFNVEECAWITQQMIAHEAVERAMQERARRAEQDYYNQLAQREYEEYERGFYESVGFDPVAMGM